MPLKLLGMNCVKLLFTHITHPSPPVLTPSHPAVGIVIFHGSKVIVQLTDLKGYSKSDFFFFFFFFLRSPAISLGFTTFG